MPLKQPPFGTVPIMSIIPWFRPCRLPHDSRAAPGKILFFVLLAVKTSLQLYNVGALKSEKSGRPVGYRSGGLTFGTALLSSVLPAKTRPTR